MTDREPGPQPQTGPYDGPIYERAWMGLGVVSTALAATESPLAQNFQYLHSALIKMTLTATVASLHAGLTPVAQLYHERDADLFGSRAIDVPTDPRKHLEFQLRAVERNFEDKACAVRPGLVVAYTDPGTGQYVTWPLEFARLPDLYDREKDVRLITTGGEVLLGEVAMYQVWLQRLPIDDQRRVARYATENHLPPPNEIANNIEETPA